MNKSSLIISIVIYLTLLIIFHIVQINNKVLIRDIPISLTIKSFTHPVEKVIKSNESEPTLEKKIFIKKNREIAQKTNLISIPSQPDSFTISNIDSIQMSDTIVIIIPDTLNKLDSILFTNPSIFGLKIALNEKLKSEGYTKTEKQIFAERIEKKMQEYYKMKYPTPIHKFGEEVSGTGIRIPIDDLIDLFK